MKLDIVEDGSHAKTWAIHSTDAFDGYDYTDDAIKFFAEREEAEDWCDAQGHERRTRVRRILVRPMYTTDCERRADRIMERIHGLGCVVRSDVTYRASAAWKENPTHYAYVGDFGGVARIEAGDRGSAAEDAAFADAKGWLRELIGMSQGLWELGLTLTFDKDGKHTIFGTGPEYVTLDRED